MENKDIEKARHTLERIEELEFDIDVLRRRVEKSRRQLFYSGVSENIVSRYGLGGRGSGTKVQEWNEINIQKYLDLSKVLSQKEIEREEIIDLIDKVPGRSKKWLYDKYVDHYTLEMIRAKIGNGRSMSRSTAYREINKAIAKFAKVMMEQKETS